MIDVWVDSIIGGLLLGLVYGLAAIGLNLIWGVMKVINLSHGAFMTLGMFVIYLLFTAFGIFPYFGLVIVIGLGLVLGMLTYFVALHRVIDAPELSTLLATFSVSLFIIGVGTFVFTTIPYAIDISLGSISFGNITILGTKVATGGAEGLYFNIKVYNAYGGAENAIWLSYYLMSALIIITLIVNWYIKKSKFGLGLMAIREDEDAAIILGVDTRKYKSLAYMLSALFPGIAGGIFFFKNGNIEPENAFHLVKSIEMIFMVMLGGFGTVTGPVLGALVYERIRGLLLINPLFKNLHIAISGVVLLLIVLFMPSGIIGYVREKIAKIRRYIE